MSASLALRGLLVVLAAVSLSLKVANGMVVVPLASDDLTQLAAALERGGFRIEESQQQNGFHLPIIKVARDDCQFLIAIVSAKGDQRAFLTQLAAPGEEVSFVYRGVISKEQPVWRPLFDQHVVGRLPSFAGNRSRSSPVLGVVAPAGCLLVDARWNNFGVEPAG